MYQWKTSVLIKLYFQLKKYRCPNNLPNGCWIFRHSFFFAIRRTRFIRQTQPGEFTRSKPTVRRIPFSRQSHTAIPRTSQNRIPPTEPVSNSQSIALPFAECHSPDEATLPFRTARPAPGAVGSGRHSHSQYKRKGYTKAKCPVPVPRY